MKDWNTNETQFGYDANGNLNSIIYPNNISASVSYDNASQLSSITDTNTSLSTTAAKESYTRDNANLITAESDTGLPTAPSSFSYNSLHEVTAASSSSFTYNSAQDLTTGPSGKTQGFNADNEVCWAGTTSSSCGAGSPPSGTTSYTYSNEGNRTALTPHSGTSYTYGYDQANNLTGVTPSSGSATTYAYDGNGLLQSETTSGTTKHYTWTVQGSLPLLAEDATNYYIYGPAGTTPVEQIAVSGGATSYLQSDQIGSVRAITNTTGTVTGTFSYDAWGNLLGSTGSATTPFAFAGAYLDPSNGFYYLRARWYDPATGQFMSLDPMVSSTLSPYGYVGNNPLNELDATGMDVAWTPGMTFDEWLLASAAEETANAELGLSIIESIASDAASSGDPNAATYAADVVQGQQEVTQAQAGQAFVDAIVPTIPDSGPGTSSASGNSDLTAHVVDLGSTGDQVSKAGQAISDVAGAANNSGLASAGDKMDLAGSAISDGYQITTSRHPIATAVATIFAGVAGYGASKPWGKCSELGGGNIFSVAALACGIGNPSDLLDPHRWQRLARLWWQLTWSRWDWSSWRSWSLPDDRRGCGGSATPATQSHQCCGRSD